MKEGIGNAITKIKDDAKKEETRWTISKTEHADSDEKDHSNESVIARESLVDTGNEVSELYPEALPVAPGFTLNDVTQVLRRKYLTLLAGALLGLALTAMMLARTTPVYSVGAKVVITRQDPGVLVNTDAGSPAFIATQAEVLGSLGIVAKAVESLPRPDHLNPDADAVAAAHAAVQASAIRNTRVVALAYLGPNGDYGASLLRAMVDAYAMELRDTIREGQIQALNAKAAELDGLLEEIADQEAQIAETRAANNIIGTADEAAEAQSVLLRDQTEQLTDVRSRRMELERRLATGGGTGLTVDDRRDRRSLREDLRLAEAELARVSRTLTDQHPTVVAARDNVEILRDQLAASDKLALEDQIAEVAGYEADLTRLVAQATRRLEAIEAHRQVENELLADLAQNRLLADSSRQELAELRMGAQLAESTGNIGVNVRFSDNPVAPENPIWPRPKLFLPAGLMIGLVGGFVFALLSLRRRRGVGAQAANS